MGFDFDGKGSDGDEPDEGFWGRKWAVIESEEEELEIGEPGEEEGGDGGGEGRGEEEG